MARPGFSDGVIISSPTGHSLILINPRDERSAAQYQVDEAGLDTVDGHIIELIRRGRGRWVDIVETHHAHLYR